MAHLINISDEIYEELTQIKKIKNASYTEIIKELLHRITETNKNKTWDDLILKAKERDSKFKGKKEHIDYDLIAYGVSRDSA